MDDFKAFFRLLDRSSRKQVILMSVLVLLAAPAELAGLGSIVLFLSVVANPSKVQSKEPFATMYELGGFDATVSFIATLGIAMIIAVTVSNALLAALNYGKMRLTWSLRQYIQVKLTKVYLERDYLWYTSQNTAELSKNILGEVASVVQAALVPFLGIVSSGFRLFALGACLIFLDPKLSAVCFLVGSVIFYVMIMLAKRKLVEKGERKREALRVQYKSCSEMLSAIKELKVFGGEDYLLSLFSESIKEHEEIGISAELVKTMPRYILQTIALSGTLGIALYLFYTGSNDDAVFTTLGGFAIGGYRMLGIGQSLFSSYSAMQFEKANLAHIKAELDELRPPIEETELSFDSEVRLEDVVFCYPTKAEPVLNGINLAIPRGTKVGFVGETGAGKTTIINLLLGLISPTSGKLRVDGVPLDASNLSSWRREIGYVPQDIFLLDDSVLKNIAFAIPEEKIDRDAVVRAAKLAQLHEFIQAEMPDGYDTLIGERGARISGGQRQRLGIARALYREPELLILDEATSALDGATESALVDCLDASSFNKTVVLIAHRLQTVKHCDQIFVLRQGAIAAQGTYQELLETNEQFRTLAGFQQVGS